MAFTAAAFERLIKYRVVDAFRPLSATVPFPPNTNSWLDGVMVTGVAFAQIENDAFVVINELQAGGSVLPNSAHYGFNAGALSMNLNTQIFFARDVDVAAAGLGRPPVFTQMIPGALIHIVVRISVDPNGIPVVKMSLDPAPLAGLGLPPPVVTGIVDAVSATYPFDIGAQLKDIFPPGNSKVLNAGITVDRNGSIVLRFEFPGQVWESAMAHANHWQTFFSPGFAANLGGADWCMDLDGGAVASGLAIMVDPNLKSKPPVEFDGTPASSGYIDDAIPRAVVTKHGRIVNACGGNDVRFDAFVNLDLTVPSENLLRGTISFDYTKNGWDVARCFGVTILNPLSIFITAFDNNEFGIGLGELAFSFVFPTKPVIALVALGLLIAGVDQSVAQQIIADRLKDVPTLTKLPDGSFAYDKALAVKNELTRDWLVLRNCIGSSGRMLLSGDLRVPDPVLPRLTASDLEGLSEWKLVDSCDPGKGQASTGSLQLSLVPGYGADIAAHQPVTRPTIPLKWGVRPTDGGDLIFQVIKDSLGIYQDPGSDYWEVYVPGIPGLVEVRLEASTVEKPRFNPFANNPYSLQLRFFTNGGVREYQFIAPPVLKQFSETPGEIAARISRCYAIGASLVLRRYLEILWLVDPPEERGGRVAQQWDVHLRGLEAGRAVTVWNAETGQVMVRAFADTTRRVDVSLLLSGHEQVGNLVMSLDDEPFLPAAEVRKLDSPDAAPGSPAAAVELIMRQTALREIDHLDFDHPIESLQLVQTAENGQHKQSALSVRTRSGSEFALAIPAPYSSGMATPLAPGVLTVPILNNLRSAQSLWRGKQRHFTVLSQSAGRMEIHAEYNAPSTYDLATGRDDLLARVSSDGRCVTLYQRSAAMVIGPKQPRHEHGQKSDLPHRYGSNRS
jgi:hypothetical protein